jgi:hypothetical protein
MDLTIHGMILFIYVCKPIHFTGCWGVDVRGVDVLRTSNLSKLGLAIKPQLQVARWLSNNLCNNPFI